MIVSNQSIAANVASSVTLPGDVSSPCQAIIANGGPDEVYMVNAGATSKADPAFSLAPGTYITCQGIGGEKMWFLCDTAESAVLTIVKSEV